MGDTYGTLVGGDEGTLSVQGTRCWDFVRER